MRVRLTLACLSLVAAVGTMTSGAKAFTFENGDDSGPYSVPKFDLDEQMRQFRKGSDGAAAASKNEFQTPLGTGSIRYGIQQGPASNFGYFGPSMGSDAASQSWRRNYERALLPENLK